MTPPTPQEAEIAGVAERRPFGVTWPEGQPEKVRCWHTTMGKHWAEFVGGLATWWPHGPLTARRMCSAWWWDQYIDGTPREVADWLEAAHLQRAQGER